MFKTKEELARIIDHTLLSPDAPFTEIKRICAEAKKYSFASVCIPPCYTAEAKEMLRDSPVKVATVVGFPFGANTTAVKLVEAVEAVKNGADELDVVINISALKTGNYDLVGREVRNLINVTRHVVHKIIIETCYLTNDEKVKAALLAVEGGALFIKTSTGFGSKGASVADVALLKKTVSDRAYIKAAGGIGDLKTVTEMVQAGASRIGTSSGVKIIEEFINGSSNHP
ncbi:MAG: deoxyribose-phosphate aldolase [Nitrospirae bacterium]|nr:deoxyribose-phosphate aldolase [Nitrospirota bacterium]